MLGLAVFAGAFAVGRGSRQAPASRDGAGASQAELAPLPAAATPPSVPRLGTVAALPALRVRHATKKRPSAQSASPTTTTSTATTTATRSTGTTGTGSTNPPSTSKQPAAKKPFSGGTDSVSSGGDSLGG